MVVGALEGERAEHGFEGLGMTASVAGRLGAGGTGPPAAAVVGQVRVEALLDGASSQLQGAAADRGFDGLEVDLRVRAAADEALDFGADVGCEALAQRFFLACPAVGSVMRAWLSCSLISTNSADRDW